MNTDILNNTNNFKKEYSKLIEYLCFLDKESEKILNDYLYYFQYKPNKLELLESAIYAEWAFQDELLDKNRTLIENIIYQIDLVSKNIENLGMSYINHYSNYIDGEFDISNNFDLNQIKIIFTDIKEQSKMNLVKKSYIRKLILISQCFLPFSEHSNGYLLNLDNLFSLNTINNAIECKKIVCFLHIFNSLLVEKDNVINSIYLPK